MIKGITRMGIGQAGNFENLVKLAAEYGFGAVDVNGDELEGHLAKFGKDGANSFLAENKVIIGAINLPVEWRQTEEKFRSNLSRLAIQAETASALGCKACCTYVLPSTDYNAAHFMALATRRLRVCAQILDAYGMKLGIEFVGPHHLRTASKHPFIWDLDSTLDWIDTIDQRNAGLLFDAYHWYTNEHTIEDILKLSPSQIVHVHINDARNVPVSEVLDNDRVYPGEGVIDLGGFLRSLKQIGYNGVIAQEILTRNPPADSAEQLLERSRNAFNSVFRTAGLE